MGGTLSVGGDGNDGATTWARRPKHVGRGMTAWGREGDMMRGARHSQPQKKDFEGISAGIQRCLGGRGKRNERAYSSEKKGSKIHAVCSYLRNLAVFTEDSKGRRKAAPRDRPGAENMVQFRYQTPRRSLGKFSH